MFYVEVLYEGEVAIADKMSLEDKQDERIIDCKGVRSNPFASKTSLECSNPYAPKTSLAGSNPYASRSSLEGSVPYASKSSLECFKVRP